MCFLLLKVGLAANFASIGILATKDMRKHTFNQLLIALAVFDILFIMVRWSIKIQMSIYTNIDSNNSIA